MIENVFDYYDLQIETVGDDDDGDDDVYLATVIENENDAYPDEAVRIERSVETTTTTATMVMMVVKQHRPNSRNEHDEK